MDGVIYHGRKLVDGAKEFVNWLKENDKKYLFLTNSSAKSPRQIKDKLAGLGIDVEEEHFMTSAMATASFLQSQHPKAGVYVIGGPGLYEALERAGFHIDDENPDYVIVGETRNYNIENIEKAIGLIFKGAKLIGTNPDLTGPSEKGIVPACQALMAPIKLTTGMKPYYIGKPNPLIMRTALKKIHCRREDTVIIGDRMDTDIIAGIESEIETVLVLSGITQKEDLKLFPYQPTYVLDKVADIAGYGE